MTGPAGGSGPGRGSGRGTVGRTVEGQAGRTVEGQASGRETLADIGEDALVAAVISRAAGGDAGDPAAAPSWLRVGPGDDAAVLDLAGPVVVSTDTLVEGHDFVREWSGGFDVGIKAAAQNLADVAAMGATPRALLVSLVAPGDLLVGWARDLTGGLADEASRAGAVIVGGDVSAGEQVVVTGTAVGVLQAGGPVRRSGARPGDVVALAGTTGRSAAGLEVLRAGVRVGARVGPGAGEHAGQHLGPAAGQHPGQHPDERAEQEDAVEHVVTAHLRPRPPHAAGPAAARGGATAMIDTSDGLLRDAARVAAASGVVIDLDPTALAPDTVLERVAELLEADLMVWALAGGEDHALLACFPPGQALPAEFRPIGSVLDVGEGEPRVLVGGVPWTGAHGWHHFA